MAVEQAIKEVIVRGRAEGVEQVETALDRITAAQDRTAASSTAMARVTEATSRSQLGVGSAYDRLVRSVDPVANAMAKMERATSLADRAVAQGRATLEERNRVLDMAAQRYGIAAKANDNLTRSVGLQSHEWKNLAFQANDAATMLLSGSSAFQVVASQGGQVLQVLQGAQGGVGGALKSVGSGLVGMMSPARLAFGGLATLAVGAGAALTSYLAQQKAVEQSLYGIGRASGFSAASLDRTASERAEGALLSRSDARNSLSGYAATGRIGPEMAGRLLGMERDLAKTLGIEQPEANALLAKSFADPVKGAQELNAKLGFLNDSTRRQIELQTAAGDRIGAMTTLQQAMAPMLVSVTEKTNAWAMAWDAVKRAAGNAYDTTGRALAGAFVPTTSQQLAAARDQLATTERALAAENPGSASARRAQRLGVGRAERERVAKLEYDLSWETFAENAQTETAQSAQASADAGARISRYLQEEDAIEKLRAERQALAKDMANPPRDIAPERIKEAYDKASGAVDSFLTSDDKRRQSDALTIRSINARTDAERSAIAAEQKRIELAGQALGGDERRRQIEQARTETLTRSTREAEDRLRTARDSAGLAGLLPFQRGQQEIENRYRRQNEENAGNPDALRRNAAARELDLRAYRTEQMTAPLRGATQSLAELTAANDNLVKTFGLSTAEVERVNAAQRLYNEYARAGAPVTDELRAKIEAYSAAAGKAAQSTEEITKRQQNVTQGLDEQRSATQGMMTGIFSDLRQGKSPMQGIANAFGRATDQLFDRLISKPLTEMLLGQMGKAGGGIFGDDLAKVFGGTTGITTAQATVTAASVVVMGGSVTGGVGSGFGGGIGGSGIAGGAGSGLLGFGLGGAQSSGTQAIGSGLSAFGFGANGTAGGGPGLNASASAVQAQMLSVLRAGGLTNPNALAAVAATAQRESGYGMSKVTGAWSDPGENGSAGTSGGLFSWRNERLANMRGFAARDGGDPVSAQTRFFLSENPGLTRSLQNASSPAEANSLMANAWRYAGFQGGPEYQARLGLTQSYAARGLGGDSSAMGAGAGLGGGITVASGGQIFLGDSIAKGLGDAAGSGSNFGTVGMSPSDILEKARSLGGSVSGQDVFLSSGANNPADLASVSETIKTLQANGAKVTLGGAGSGIPGLNDQLRGLSERYGTRFQELGPTADGVHPSSYGGLLGRMRGRRADAGDDMDGATSRLASNTDEATDSVTKLGDATGQLPDSFGGASDALSSFASQLSNFKPGASGGGLASLFGLGGGGSNGGTGGNAEGFDLTLSAFGNIMTSSGPLALNRYAGGGVANSPQVSIFGEGRQPEAYVPLPDGRSIPVSLDVPMAPVSNSNMPALGNISYNPSTTINGSGLSREELAGVLANERKQAMEHMKRNFGAIGSESGRRYG